MDRNDIEKITDDIMIIANRVMLRMNVVAAYYNNENKRYCYHREVEFFSQKVNKNLINIKRHFDYYLSIENIQTKDYIRIGVTEIYKLQYALEEAYKFFTDPKYSKLYVKKDGEMIIYMKVNPIIIDGLPLDKYLQFEPIVYTNFRGEPERGLRMYLSSQESYCDISLRNLEGFLYIIKNINLYQAGLSLINYIGRPELGTNLFTYNTEQYTEEDANFKGKDGRIVAPVKSNVSYFDRMKNLE